MPYTCHAVFSHVIGQFWTALLTSDWSYTPFPDLRIFDMASLMKHPTPPPPPDHKATNWWVPERRVSHAWPAGVVFPFPTFLERLQSREFVENQDLYTKIVQIRKVKEVRIYIKKMRNKNGSPVKNKQHHHSRHLASYLVYGSEALVRA